MQGGRCGARESELCVMRSKNAKARVMQFPTWQLRISCEWQAHVTQASASRGQIVLYGGPRVLCHHQTLLHYYDTITTHHIIKIKAYHQY